MTVTATTPRSRTTLLHHSQFLPPAPGQNYPMHTSQLSMVDLIASAPQQEIGSETRPDVRASRKLAHHDRRQGIVPAARLRGYTFSSKQIGELCSWGDACCRKGSGEYDLYVARGIVSRQAEFPRVMISVRTQCDLFKDLCPTGRVPNSARATGGVISLPRNVIEEVGEFSRPFPNTQAVFPSCAGREEFMISVPSACHTTTELSISTPGLGIDSPFMLLAVHTTCHIPTMDGESSKRHIH